MPINIGMPVAHETGAANYATYYSGGDCIFQVPSYFNRGGCQGLCLEMNPAAPVVLLDTHWDLYAFTDGFISFQGNSIVLRLPKELNAAAFQQHNSGRQFLALTPRGPQLRHVIYAFPTDPGAAVDDKIRAILNDAAHPGRNMTRVPDPAGGTQTLQAYLAADPANVNNALQEFRNGNIELFVEAGDVLGNFMSSPVEIRFLDSSGTLAPTAGPLNPITPPGRPLNPSYYLYLVRHAGNAANVTMLTSFVAPSPDLDHTHPLDHLFSRAAIAAAVDGNPEQELDVGAAHPPKPLHVTIAVQNAAGADIAGKGIHIGSLGNWHESRNASDPYNTNAPVRWRNYGTMAGDINFADYCGFVTQVKADQNNRLPGGAAFNHQHPPAVNHTNRIETYWTRYAAIFNAVAKAFEMPCELLVSIACKETAGGPWYNQGNFAASREMDVIRLEPLMVTIGAAAPVPLPNQVPALVTANAAHQGWLANYQNLAGFRVRQAGAGVVLQAGGGANADIPVPWNGAGQVSAPNALSWEQLRDLIDDYPNNVKVSPGVMQTLVETAREDTQWIAQIYGNAYVQEISILHDGVNLVADNPPNDRGDLFEDWFSVSVDAAGNNTDVAADVDQA